MIKKIFMLLAFCGLMFATVPTIAADVDITITIPDAYVSRVADAVDGSLGASLCGVQLTTKECLKKFLIREIKRLVLQYEMAQAQKAAESSCQEIEIE